MNSCKLRAAVLAVLVISLAIVGCASVDEVLVNKEAGFYYGSGSGTSEASATASAYEDFIYNVLVDSGSIKAEKKTKFKVTPEMKAAFDLLKLKPFNTEKKAKDQFSVVFRIAAKDWDKFEQKRLDGLVKTLGAQFAALKAAGAKPLAERLNEAAAIQVAVLRNGVSLHLVEGTGSNALLADAVEAYCKTATQGLGWTLAPDSGLLNSETKLSLTVIDQNGKPIAGVPLTLTWSVGAKSITSPALTGDATGKATFALAADPGLRNQKLVLRIQTAFTKGNPDAPILASLDAGFVKDYNFRHADGLGKSASDEVKLPGGTYAIGKVPQDTTFGVATKEKVRQVTVASFYMDRNLVTNAEYRTFLESTRAPKSAFPDYMDNEEFNAPDQPVIGVTLDEAKKYAAWISGVLGTVKRLPTEDEYEIAARAGQTSIYPWGDQKPSDGERANYAGNKRFTGTSPVGSFENGKNPLGLTDMVGNVWEWTSSQSGDKAIAKGGSYMDAPAELRISNRRFEDPASGYADIGFRLMREAGNE